MITRSKLIAASEAAGELGNGVERVNNLSRPATYSAQPDNAVDPDPTFSSSMAMQKFVNLAGPEKTTMQIFYATDCYGCREYSSSLINYSSNVLLIEY